MKKIFINIFILILAACTYGQDIYKSATTTSSSGKMTYSQSGADKKFATNQALTDSILKVNAQLLTINGNISLIQEKNNQQDGRLDLMEQVTQIQADQIRALNDTLNKITAMVLFTNNTIAQLNNTVSNLSGRVNQLEQTTNKQIVQINAIYDSLKLQRGWNLMQDQQIKSNTDSINKILSWKQYYKSPLMLTGPYGDTTIIDIPLLKSQLQ